jgi:hypothetical protein
MTRQPVSAEIRRQILHEAGYRCANPICRMVLAINIHHLDAVSKGGGNGAENLIALCPNCHTLHHLDRITHESLRTWKLLLLSLNQAFDRKTIDILLALGRIQKITLRGEGMLEIAALISSGLVDWKQCHTDVFDIMLSKKGTIFVQAWTSGRLEEAVSAGGLGDAEHSRQS